MFNRENLVLKELKMYKSSGDSMRIVKGVKTLTAGTKGKEAKNKIKGVSANPLMTPGHHTGKIIQRKK